MEEIKLWEDRASLTHVKSHQDLVKPIKDLTWDEYLNYCADKLATQHLSTTEPSPWMVPIFPASQAQLNVQGITITHHVNKQLHFAATHKQHWKYLCRIHKYNPNIKPDMTHR